MSLSHLMQLLPSLLNPVTTLRPIFIATLSVEFAQPVALDRQVYCGIVPCRGAGNACFGRRLP
jgi:hypothetical protein